MGQLPKPLTEDQLNPIPDLISEMALRFRLKQGVVQQREGEDAFADRPSKACFEADCAFADLGHLAAAPVRRRRHSSVVDEGGVITGSIHHPAALGAEAVGWHWNSWTSKSRSSPLTVDVAEALLSPPGAVCVRWSRFVQITPEADGVLLESPLQGSRLVMHHACLSPLIWELGVPSD